MSYVDFEQVTLPQPYTPEWLDLEQAFGDELFSEAAFYLLVECGQLLEHLAVVKPRETVDRNQAVLTGHLVRMTKLMRIAARDVSNREVDQQQSLSREHSETAATLKWLLQDDGSGSRYDMYIENGLGAERINMATVEQNVELRGESMPVEDRMLTAASFIIRAAGIKDMSAIRSHNALKAAGFPSIKQLIEGLGPVAYFAYRAVSAEVHGTWSHLIQYHVTFDGTDYSPNFTKPPITPHVATNFIYVTYLVAIDYAKTKLQAQSAEQFIPRFEAIEEKRIRLIELREKAIARDNELRETGSER